MFYSEVYKETYGLSKKKKTSQTMEGFGLPPKKRNCRDINKAKTISRRKTFLDGILSRRYVRLKYREIIPREEEQRFHAGRGFRRENKWKIG